MIPTVEILAKQISKDLYNSRKKGNSNPDNPVNAQTMCTAYHALYKWDVTDREIREATKYLVEECEPPVPIGTTLQGCYYVLVSDEWQPTLDMLLPKFLSMKRKIDAINKMRKEMAEKEAHQESLDFSAVGKLLNDKLDLQKVA